ncbi:MAG: hypothetical protein A3B90_02025 [Candidatus Magasanikbacteria bacterium RIFCSPHIGHO2_02_FULL_41_13]|uniref:DoxX family protein n=1 Tax=Candidatus Magasanikbacteria bacterium RIFCSPHIGHO2_02_FULL_41_13 TaxID=1798676 RepID=A0A1F6M5X4_9BACT|nr:MAG: hypothetical protein A3B90_02025 [Candidatus Magasanikbacteria bacterium RIFCSPHIGHO2_02_FULL_41_13]
MDQNKRIEWILRVAVAGEFIGHGVFATQQKAQWLGWIQKMLSVEASTAGVILLCVGAFDVLVGLIILLKPIKPILLWATFWGFWTALVRPIMGDPIWDFIERWANWGAPLALYFLMKGSKKK